MMRVNNYLKAALVAVGCCCGFGSNAQTFSWSSYTTGSMAYSCSAMGTSVTMSAALSGSGYNPGFPTYATSGGYSYLYEQVDWPNTSKNAKTTITFSAPIQGVNFLLFDIDAYPTNHDDRVTVYGKTALGVNVYPTITRSTFNHITGANNNILDADTLNMTFSNGPASVDFGMSMITELHINWTSGTGTPSNPGLQEIGIGDISFFVALPVKLSAFTALKDDRNNINLEWTGQDEKNLRVYQLERWCGAGFSVIAELTAHNIAGPSHYRYTDNETQHGTNLYRLKMVNEDGSFTYSRVIQLELNKISVSEVFPTPFSNEITVKSHCENPGTLKVQILNLMGAVVYEKSCDVPEGEYSSKFAGLEVLKKGFYIIRVSDGSENILHSSKILKD